VHRYFAPGALILRPVSDGRSDLIVSIAEDVRLHLNYVPDDPLDGVTPAIQFRGNPLDYHAVGGQPE
jgi:hypothetical protein